MSDVYVMGVDMIKFGRFPDRSVPNIGAEAALMALDDAGLGIQDMQAFIVETWDKLMQWLVRGYFKKLVKLECLL